MKRLLFTILVLCLALSCSPNDGQDLEKADKETPADESPASCPATIDVDSTWPLLSISSEECGIAWSRINIQVAITQGDRRVWYKLSAWPENHLESDTEQTTLTLTGHTHLPDLTILLQKKDNGVVIKTLMTPINATLHFGGLRLNGFIKLPDNPRVIHWLHNGYDSWTYTGIAELSPNDEPIDWVDGAEAPLGNNYGYWADRKLVSWWTTALRSPQNPMGIVAGALSANRFKTYFTADYDRSAKTWRLSTIIGTPNDKKRIEIGDTLELDPIFILLSPNPVYGLLEYGDAVAETRPPLSWEGYNPKGWATWYDYFNQVSQKDVLANLQVMKNKYLAHGFEVCQLDDGYMNYWGDWQDTNERFPDGLAFLAEQIKKAGLVPGIWMAPLMADQQAQVVSDHPDWFLQDPDGNFIYVGDFLMGPKVTLDITNPDAAAWLSDQIKTMVDQGFKYLKLDFLFAGAVEADRYDTNITSLEAYALACDIIQKAAGDGVYLLASGQPFLPSAGRFHAARSSSDICGEPIDAPLWKMVHNIARYNAARFYAQDRFFSLDPDQLLVRAPLGYLQAEMTLASNVLLGGNLWLGDALVDLPIDREALILSDFTADLESLPKPAIPLDLFTLASERIVNAPYFDLALNASKTPKAYLTGSVLTLFNWRGNFDEINLTLKQLGFEQAASVTAVNRSTGEEILPQDGSLRFSLSELGMEMYDLVEK